MDVTIENNQVVVDLDETEFPLFEAMFNNLNLDKFVRCEFREFGSSSYVTSRKLLPMHLCRTIGEANLSEDPFATVSLYPFWKFGFAFGESGELRFDLGIEDPHKKAVAADEFGMGFCAWAMEELFDCEFWADTSTLIKNGAVFPIGTKRPDFVCGFSDGSLGIFEAKGTTGSIGDLTSALAEGKLQTSSIGAQDPISQRVAVGCALGGGETRVVLLDPPESDDAKPTNLTADLVRLAAMNMRKFPSKKRGGGEGDGVCIPVPTESSREASSTSRSRPLATETIFRAGDKKITMKFDNLRKDKRHGWLDIK